MAIYRIRLPEAYDIEAGTEADALIEFHNQLTSLLNGGSELDTTVTQVFNFERDDEYELASLISG